MESQNAGWIYIGRERELNKLYIKTEQLQEEEWGSFLGTGMEQLPGDTGGQSTNWATSPVNYQQTQSDKMQTTEQCR